jgi:hypothetical protein
MRIARVVAASMFALAAVAQAQTASGPVYGPFEGAGYLSTEGYQEIKLSADRWYVAYQGNRDTSPDWVAAAWSARAAQVCKAAGAATFVELRYPFEAVTADDELAQADGSPEAGGVMLPVAGPVYIPIYTPSNSGPRMPLIAPSKLAAVRCVVDVARLKDAARAISGADAIAKARGLGMAMAP